MRRGLEPKPEATPELLLETARKLSVALGKPLDTKMLNAAATHLSDEYRVGEYLPTEAGRLLKLETNPDLLVFQNSRVTYMVTDGNEYWQTIKAIKSNNPTLADMKQFINTLIHKYGEDKQFSATSDRGDEFFSLRLKAR